VPVECPWRASDEMQVGPGGWVPVGGDDVHGEREALARCGAGRRRVMSRTRRTRTGVKQVRREDRDGGTE
jgi:hypothetical protein